MEAQAEPWWSLPAAVALVLVAALLVVVGERAMFEVAVGVLLLLAFGIIGRNWVRNARR